MSGRRRAGPMPPPSPARHSRSPRPQEPPRYSARRRTLHTGTDLLTDKKKQRLETLFATDEHLQVEATWGVYQPMIAAQGEPRSGAMSSCDNSSTRSAAAFPPP